MKDLCKLIVPALTPALHKGQAGRIAIVGGCEEYTGAPYFAGMSALRLGADLVHIMCTPSAAVPIKSYNPDLMVLPILCKEKAAQFNTWVDRLHCVVFGPGLGRDLETKSIVSEWITITREKNIPIVVDADGLHLVTEQPNLVKDYSDAILTPNVIEFDRLYYAMKNEHPQIKPTLTSDILSLCKELKCSIVCKGEIDKICTGESTVECSVTGSYRRVGGQGDLLSGALGLFAHWAKNSPKLPPNVPYQNIAAYAACAVVKQANFEAFHSTTPMQPKRGRSMITSDMINHLNAAFCAVFECEVED